VAYFRERINMRVVALILEAAAVLADFALTLD
jgi:hypothetical protein